MSKVPTAPFRSARFRKRLPERMDAYLAFCRPPPDADPKKLGRLANVAGFCSYLGCGLKDWEELHSIDPSLYTRLCACLEDAALNYAPNATLVHSYLKRRLGYGDSAEEEGKQTECAEMHLIFEHDAEEDGA